MTWNKVYKDYWDTDVPHADTFALLVAIDIHSFFDSVATLKHTLQFQAEEGARLEDDNQELEFRLTKVLESHQ